ncbi:hypothetical protein N431DRAFT_63246 [Stipitochalara longipes BDJ]|nr:hypothetical protein N431DRAFT_63246 [Stipitochalara longipes BDJ]
MRLMVLCSGPVQAGCKICPGLRAGSARRGPSRRPTIICTIICWPPGAPWLERERRRASGSWWMASGSSGREETGEGSRGGPPQDPGGWSSAPGARQTAPLAPSHPSPPFASAGGVASGLPWKLRPTYAPNLRSNVSQRRLPCVESVEAPIGAFGGGGNLSPTVALFAVLRPAFVPRCLPFTTGAVAMRGGPDINLRDR